MGYTTEFLSAHQARPHLLCYTIWASFRRGPWSEIPLAFSSYPTRNHMNLWIYPSQISMMLFTLGLSPYGFDYWLPLKGLVSSG